MNFRLFFLNDNFPLACETRGRAVYLGKSCVSFTSVLLCFTGFSCHWSCPTTTLPTTPTALLAIACFSKSSKRFETGYHTKHQDLYKLTFRKAALENEEKNPSYLYLDGDFYLFCPSFAQSKIRSGSLTIFITYYLFKVIPDKE